MLASDTFQPDVEMSPRGDRDRVMSFTHLDVLSTTWVEPMLSAVPKEEGSGNVTYPGTSL